MKKILLAAAVFACMTGMSSASVNFTGTANTGIISSDSELHKERGATAGIDLNISASVTTDNGITLTVADDFGGGYLIDWNDDYRIEEQPSDLGQPSVSVAFGKTRITLDPDGVDDLYDDAQTGDMHVRTAAGNLSVDLVVSNNNDDDGIENGTTANGTNSYAFGYDMGDIDFSIIGTDSGEGDQKESTKYKATYAMGLMTFGIEMDNQGDLEDVTTGSISYNMGNGVSFEFSAADNEDWDGRVSYSSGPMSVTYATDEESSYEAHASYQLGNGVKLFAATAEVDDYSALGI